VSSERASTAKESKPSRTLAEKRYAAKRKDGAEYGVKRDTILRAAGTVLRRNALSGTTIDAVAKEAGVDRATIYYYFEDKYALCREAIHEGIAEIVAALEEIAKSGDPPEVRLRTSMRAVMRAYEKHYPQLYIFFQIGGTPSVIDNQLNMEIISSGRRYEHLLEVTVCDGIDTGVIAISLPPKVFAKLVVGMLNWTARWFDPGGALTAESIADGMADAILNGALVRYEPRFDTRMLGGCM
jgi:AcrR family transcriptional regulator